MNYVKFLCRSIILFFWFPLYCMEQQHTSEKITEAWNEKTIKKIVGTPELLSMRDISGNTALMYLADTITYTDVPHYYIPTLTVRNYSFTPELLLKLIQKSDLTIKNNNGITAFDILLEKIGKGFFHTTKFLGNYYSFNEEKSTGNTLCMTQSLLIDLVKAMGSSGYDFNSNSQTTFDRLGSNFSFNLHLVIKELLRMGMPLKNISSFSENESLMLCLQNRDYSSIHSNMKTTLFHAIFETLQKSDNYEDRTLFSDMFIRLIAQNNKNALKLFGDAYPSHFFPLKAFEYAMDYNGWATVPFILRSFYKTTLANLYAKLQNKKIPFKSTGFDTKLYDLYKKAKKAQRYRFCSGVENYSSAVTAFMNAQKNGYTLNGLLADTILSYIL